MIEPGDVVRITTDPKSAYHHRVGTVERIQRPKWQRRARTWYWVRIHGPVQFSKTRPAKENAAGYFKLTELEPWS